MCFARAPDIPATERPADHLTIERLFDRTFAAPENTRLCGGAAEPLYLPAVNADDARSSWDVAARIHYREDFAASALHEVAHWCIAGRARRRLVDYGYWYAPDGRNVAQQRDFMRVEARPQALEWCFTRACGRDFRLSFDNVDASPTPREHELFARCVLRCARAFARDGMPPRAQRFFEALCREFLPGLVRSQLHFSFDELLP